MRSTFDVELRIGIVPILKDGKIDGAICGMPASRTLYMGDYSLNAYFVPAYHIRNKTNEVQDYSAVVKVNGESLRWSGCTTGAWGANLDYASSYHMTAGNYECTLYIDGVEVASGQYKLMDRRSNVPSRNCDLSAILRIWDSELDEYWSVGLDAVAMDDLADG